MLYDHADKHNKANVSRICIDFEFGYRENCNMRTKSTLVKIAEQAGLAPSIQVRSTPIKTKLNPATNPRSTSPRLAAAKLTKRRVVA